MDKRFETVKKPFAIATISAIGMLGLGACESDIDPSAHTCTTERLKAERGDTSWELAKQALAMSGEDNAPDPRIIEVIEDTEIFTELKSDNISAGKEYPFIVCAPRPKP